MKPEPKKEPQKSSYEIIQLANYVRPEVKEQSGKDFVLNGPGNEFYKYIIDRYNGSPTNRAIIDSYAKFIYGKGLMSKQQSTKAIQFAYISKILSKKDLKAVCSDYALFGEASVELIYKDGLKQIKHVPKNCIAPSKLDEDGDITAYWYSRDFKKPTGINTPKEFDAFGFHNKKSGSCIYIFKDYQVGKTYYSDPTYLAGLPYAELEEEIANYCINHIKNGLSFGHLINFNNGVPNDEEKKKMIDDYRGRLTGSINAGKIVFAFNDNKEAAATVEALEVSDAHQQYEFLSGEATQKIMISHCVTSPILFGIKDSTGLGNNANEMESAFNELMINVIQPKKEVILDGLMQIFSAESWTIDLDFIPLRTIVQPKTTSLSKHDEEHEEDDILALELIEKGEYIDSEEWELIDQMEVNEDQSLGESTLELTVKGLKLASTITSAPEEDSDQDTPIFKIRYSYAGNPLPQRDFCVKMMSASKVYRKEDIEAAGSKSVNPGLGPKGSNTYPIWLFKGGANCNHYWQRRIYLRKENKSISASKAREILNELEPKVRRENAIEQNNPLVAKRPEDMPNNGYLS